MKKRTLFSVAALALAALLALSGCAGNGTPNNAQEPDTSGNNQNVQFEAVDQGEDPEAEQPEALAEEERLVTVTIGASPVPHAEILKAVQESLKTQGIDLQIQEFTDYIIPNTALHEGKIDGNFFQHVPYLEKFNAENQTELVSIALVHYEPMCIFGGKTSALADIKKGAQIALPNDPTNEARALLLLQDNGLLTLKPDAGINATPKDIEDNPLDIKFVELEAAQVARSLQDVDAAVINGNYALEAGLAIGDALAYETSDSQGAGAYANALVVRAEDAEDPDLKKVADTLTSEIAKQFIRDNYQGAVVPME